MINRIIADTGAIVAALDRGETNHEWALENFRTLSKPFLTCEAVINEVCYLMRSSRNGERDALYLLSAGALTIDFALAEEVENIISLMKKYESVPMSLADGCLVRMSEMIPDSSVFTLDSDFLVYRKNRNGRIPLIIPDVI